MLKSNLTLSHNFAKAPRYPSSLKLPGGALPLQAASDAARSDESYEMQRLKGGVMAVHFQTTDPQGLLDQFDARILQKAPAGRITTWSIVDSGGNRYYTHDATQWKKKAFFKARIGNGVLTFNIIKSSSSNVSSIIYAFYHGHLIETFLNHFEHEFSTGAATALAVAGDKCS
jgi:hypothetical protein